ncbi:hypothetical protein [Celeribacter indicus]|uniref:Uncharacterized protein n=1 Tax=Celeribacter indicus TaxID=1208324 RepID=A0A0B5DUV0_9RHOB|nr:hypothetical protein [Celeribacter indicus]AJE47173.1 hypothetical protein P73_2458 [Celeribacter indicus]SDW00090.1 hypothetical protein SAMN05443573_1018 [Celeribacter indicus]
MKSKMAQHIQAQQDLACSLKGIIEAILVLDDQGVAPDAVTALLNVALDHVIRLNHNLDVVALPEEEGAA